MKRCIYDRDNTYCHRFETCQDQTYGRRDTGTKGTAGSVKIADITLMSDDLEKLAGAVNFVQCTVTVIKEDIAFALLVKGVFFARTLVGLVHLWLAVFEDLESAIMVTLN